MKWLKAHNRLGGCNSKAVRRHEPRSASTIATTGATKGIGLAVSRPLADAGHHVIGVARGVQPAFPGRLVSIDLMNDETSKNGFADLARKYSEAIFADLGFAVATEWLFSPELKQG